MTRQKACRERPKRRVKYATSGKFLVRESRYPRSIYERERGDPMEPVHQSLTLGSLFDGIGGWQLAAVRNGIKPIWSSEIEP